MNKPLVSICCITYNHEEYIEECIKGFLNQKVNFEIEFLIHDDASTDSTQKIIKKLVGNDSRFKLILRKKNIKSTGKVIFPILFEKAIGKYIAMCEGDDYWTDTLKLQKQVDFLESHSNYCICYHRVHVLQDGILKSDANDITEKRFNEIVDKSRISISDLLKYGNFIHTVSVLFRKSELGSTPFETSYSTVGDYFLYIRLTANNKLIKKMDDTMAIYRRGVGVYSSLNSITMSYDMIQYKLSILSYLTNDSQKEILLKKTTKELTYIKKRELQKKKISEYTFRQLLIEIVKKIKRSVL